MRVVYLHGFASGPNSSKANFFRSKLEACGIPVSIPDLAEGDFEHLTITKQLKVVERSIEGSGTILIGSSMGGYLAALYAARNSGIDRLVLLAPAFGFSSRWPETLGVDAMNAWRTSGFRKVFHYGQGKEVSLSYGLIEDAEEYEDYPTVTQPTLILHGTRDTVVPSTLSSDFATGRSNVRLVLLDSDHALTDASDRLWMESAEFLAIDPEKIASAKPQV